MEREHPQPAGIAELEALAASLRRRLALRWGLAGAVRGLAAGAGVGVVLVAVDRLLLARAPDGVLDPWIAGLPVLAAAGAAGWAVRRLPGTGALLALADRARGTREVMVTAWELAQAGGGGGVAAEVVARGIAASRGAPAREVLPLRAPASLRIAAALCLLLGLSPLVPRYVPEAVAREMLEKSESARAGERLAEDLARLEREADPAPAPLQAEQAIDKAFDVAKEMARGDLDRLASLEKLSQIEQEAETAKGELGFEEVKGAFDRAAREMERQGLAGELSKALSRTDARSLEEELRALAEELARPSQVSEVEMSRIAESFSRLGTALDRMGEGELSRAARDVSSALEARDGKKAADGIERLAADDRMDSLAADREKSTAMSRALDASEETQPAVERLSKQDASGTEKAFMDLAKALREGKRQGSFEDKQLRSLGKAVKKLGEDLEGTDLKRLSASMKKAGAELERGDAAACARTIKDIDPGSIGQCSALQQGDARLDDLSRVVAEARAMLGQQADRGPGEKPGASAHGRVAAGEDYGVGTSSTEEEGGRQDTVHHNRDRTGTSRSTWTEAYEKKYEPMRLEGAQGAPTFVRGEASGPADYLEFRGVPGKEEPAAAAGAAPAGYRKAAEDALSKEEIPPGYRDQIKQYFDELPAPPEPPRERGEP